MSPRCVGACQQPVFFGPAKPLDRRLSLEGRRLGLLGLAVGQFHGETALEALPEACAFSRLGRSLVMPVYSEPSEQRRM